MHSSTPKHEDLVGIDYIKELPEDNDEVAT